MHPDVIASRPDVDGSGIVRHWFNLKYAEADTTVESSVTPTFNAEDAMKYRLLSTCCAALLSACVAAAPSPLNDAERQAIADSLNGLTEEITNAAEAVDSLRVSAPFSARPEFTSAYEGTLVSDNATFRSNVQKGYAALRSQNLIYSSRITHVLTRDIAVTAIAGSHTATTQDGVNSPARPFAATLVWQREGEEWKVVAVHQSLGTPRE